MNRKSLVFFTLLFCFVFVAVGLVHAEENRIQWGQVDTYAQLKREIPRDVFQVGLSRGGTSTVTTGTTAIPLGYSVVKIICGASSKTIANGYSGQVLHIVATETTGTVTITPATATGWVSAAMDANGESLTIQFVDDTLGWIVTGIVGTTVTGVNN